MRLDQYSIRTQLLVGFGVTLAIFMVAVLGAFWQLLQVETDVDMVVGNRYPKVMQAQAVVRGVIDNGRSLRAAAMAETTADADAAIERIRKTHQSLSDDIDRLLAAMTTPKGRELAEGMATARTALTPMYEQSFSLIRGGDKSKANLYLKEVAAANNALWAAADAFGKYQEGEMEKAAAAAKSAVSTVQTVLLIAALIAAVISIGIALRFSGQVGRRLAAAVGVADAIAAGRLDSHVNDDGADEIGALLRAMDQMQAGLRGMVGEIGSIVDAAERGNLKQRMSLQGKQGFGLQIGESLNRLVETVDASLQDIANVAKALAEGDLSREVSGQYAGAFGETAQAVNQTVFSLRSVLSDVQAMVDAASHGDFSHRMELDGRRGYALNLAEMLNALGDTANRALSDISRVSVALAQGDLTQKIDQSYPGLFGATAESMNAICDNLQSLVGDIAGAVSMISTAAKEIASGNQDLSSRTEEQASSLEETASSMEQLTSTVKQNTSNAVHASELARAAEAVAKQGGGVVQQVVETMTTIHQSSARIGDIISVIDGIAFQTNILALNAAVEAARAGEQGRGFAVVATEVRNLAQRSASAAREIKDLISDSVSKVDMGNRQVGQAGETMAQVVSSISEVAQIMAEISEASREQTAGIEQVSLAVSQMDEVTQQNAALVEEAAAAAESLDDQAHSLSAAVGKFKLANTGRPMLAAPGGAGKPQRGAVPSPRASSGGRPVLASPKSAAPDLDGDWAEF